MLFHGILHQKEHRTKDNQQKFDQEKGVVLIFSRAFKKRQFKPFLDEGNSSYCGLLT
jgi:hypothetical protein